MAQFAVVPLISLPLPTRISSFSQYMFGTELANAMKTAPASLAWPDDNRAVLLPLTIPSPYTIRFFRFSAGAVQSGNFDMGVYDHFGTLLRSLGSTTFPAPNSFSSIPITALTLQPGTYFVAFVIDNQVAEVFGQGFVNARVLVIAGLRGASPAFPLPLSVDIKASPLTMVPQLYVASDE